MAVQVNTTGWVQGRNQLSEIKALNVWIGGDLCYFDFISKKSGKVINGGGAITPEAMDELALEWLKQRGKI